MPLEFQGETRMVVFAVCAALFFVGAVGLGLYGLVRFVKWAWKQGEETPQK